MHGPSMKATIDNRVFHQGSMTLEAPFSLATDICAFTATPEYCLCSHSRRDCSKVSIAHLLEAEDRMTIIFKELPAIVAAI